MNLIPALNILSFISCIIILIFIFRYRKIFGGPTITFIVAAGIIITFITVSNLIEDFTSFTSSHQYEDYLEILFVPLIVFSIYSLSLNRELKKRKAAEESLKEQSIQLSYALEGANEGLWDWNINDNSFFFNAEFYKVLGYKPFSFPPDKKNWLGLIHPDHLKAEEEYMNSFFHGNPESNSLELLVSGADGMYKWMLLKGKTVKRHSDGSPSRISGILLDISRIKKFEEELINAKEKAESSDRLKSAFLANMSHDIRTPLNGILGFTELLQFEDITREKQIEYLSFIKQNGFHLLNLINDIIEISKIESEQITLNFEDFNINALIEEIFMFYKTSQNKKIKNLRFSYSPGLGDAESFILSDKTRIKQILINLIDNALKHTDEGYVNFGYVADKQTKIKFFVEDSGIGIESKDQEVIFERFMKANHTDKTRSGTGLGLAICKGLITKLKGKIWVDSIPNKGSTFYFTIPYKKGNTELSNVKQSEHKSFNFTGKKILLVEDNDSNMFLLTEVLKNTGATLFKANDGDTALKIFANITDLDILLIDIQLPDTTGHNLIKIIRQTNTSVPAIAQTAFASETEKKKSLQSGFTDYISKPINPMQLRSMIQRYLL